MTGNMTDRASETTKETVDERGFIAGELIVLRPVKEGDLPELARLMAENPHEHENLPWTHQRLKKKFEDKDKPGLWTDEERVLVAVRRNGGVVGHIHERIRDSNKSWVHFHVDQAISDRDAVGREVLNCFMELKQQWLDPKRIGVDILEVEDQKAAWLEAAGFEYELTHERAVMYQGRPAGIKYYAWLSEHVRQNLATPEPESAGQP